MGRNRNRKSIRKRRIRRMSERCWRRTGKEEERRRIKKE